MIAYITGASSGLGAYTAQALADNGWAGGPGALPRHRGKRAGAGRACHWT